MMIGIDSYIATKRSLVGVDWLNLTSGAFKTAGAAASSFGGGSAGGTGGDTQAQAAALEKAQLEVQKKAAEQRASTWKLVGVAGIIAVVIGGVVLYRR